MVVFDFLFREHGCGLIRPAQLQFQFFLRRDPRGFARRVHAERVSQVPAESAGVPHLEVNCYALFGHVRLHVEWRR